MALVLLQHTNWIVLFFVLLNNGDCLLSRRRQTIFKFLSHSGMEFFLQMAQVDGVLVIELFLQAVDCFDFGPWQAHYFCT